MTADHLSVRTLRKLSKSPYAPPELTGEPVLRSDILLRLLLERLNSLGPMLESEAVISLDDRAGVVGRGAEIVTYAAQRGLIRRIPGADGEPAQLEAVGAPRSLAA